MKSALMAIILIAIPPALVLGQVATPAVREALNAAIQDEYRSEALYQGVLNQFEGVRPFSMIVRSEGMHIQALQNLFRRYNLPVPRNRYDDTDFPTYKNVQEACSTGVDSEKANVAVYDRYLAEGLPADVRQVFLALQGASRDRHLVAFTNCGQGMGGMGPGGMGPGWRGGRGRGMSVPDSSWAGRGMGPCRQALNAE